MKKFFILIPVYNDWKSLRVLLKKINEEILNKFEAEFHCLIIDDASSNVDEIQKPKSFKSLKIITLKKNQGHARSNAIGLRYLIKNESFNFVILMDGDGEDRPEEIKLLINKALNLNFITVVARRVKRSEGIVFKLLYEIHKIITFVFTGKKIYFGNYCCLSEKDANKISTKASLWSSFSGSVKRYVFPIEEINSFRGLRYFGPSKMSLYKLVIHSFAIMAVFKTNVFIRSILLSFLIIGLNFFFNLFWLLLFLLIFNFLIFLVSKRENLEELLNSSQNIDKINTL